MFILSLIHIRTNTLMSIISLANSKGGAGKTTVAELIVGTVARAGHRVAVIDADYNETLATWVRGFSLPVDVHTELDEDKLFKLAADLDTEYDLVVIDTAGAAGRSTLFAMAQSDLAIIPVKLSGQDVTEVLKTVTLAGKAGQVTGRNTETRVLLNEYAPRTVIAQHIESQLAEHQLPMMKTRLQDLVAFKEMSLNGEVPSRGSAGAQVRGFIKELADLGVVPAPDPTLVERLLRRAS